MTKFGFMDGSQLQHNENWYDQRLQDGGPVYAETDLDRFIVEPWNAVSSLLIIIPALYWLWRISGRYSDFKFLTYAIPLVIAGGLGSALFHGLRVSVVFLVMDVLPSAILTLSISIYFWVKVLKKWWYIFFIVVPVMALRFFAFRSLEGSLAINTSYLITGILVGLPLLIILYLTGYYKIIYALLGIGLFILALVARGFDSELNTLLPMGSHFLWHTFAAAGAFFVLGYLYYFREAEMKKDMIFVNS